jgi:hypothetical protein
MKKMIKRFFCKHNNVEKVYYENHGNYKWTYYFICKDCGKEWIRVNE